MYIDEDVAILPHPHYVYGIYGQFYSSFAKQSFCFNRVNSFCFYILLIYNILQNHKLLSKKHLSVTEISLKYYKSFT